MKQLLLYSILFFTANFAYGQEPINKYDAAGKKDGKWIVYLDAYWNKTDSSKAQYYRYTWYDHGVNIHPMGAGGGKNSALKMSVEIYKQTEKILNGEYKWYDKGKLKYVHVLKNGEYVSYKEYSADGVLVSFFDYTKGCEGQAHSWTIYLYDKKGNLKMTSLTCKDKNGKWPRMSD